MTGSSRREKGVIVCSLFEHFRLYHAGVREANDCESAEVDNSLRISPSAWLLLLAALSTSNVALMSLALRFFAPPLSTRLASNILLTPSHSL